MQRPKLNYVSKRATSQFNPSGVKTNISLSNAIVADSLAFRVAKSFVGMLVTVCNMNILIFICSAFQQRFSVADRCEMKYIIMSFSTKWPEKLDNVCLCDNQVS